MISCISGILVGFMNSDKICKEGLDLNDSSIPYQIIGCSFFLECLVGLILGIKWLIKKLMRR